MSQRDVNVLRLFTFGGLGIEPDDGSTAPRLRPPRLALLAAIAAAGERGVSRERLVGLFWPEADDQHASHSLRQARYALRNDLGQEVIRADGAVYSLDGALISSDITEFHANLTSGDKRRAVELARGPFLDGFYLAGASAFERWVEEERARLATTVTSALVSLAKEASQAGERDQAVEWWRQLTIREPLSGRFAIGYLKALGVSGHRVEALAFARQHEVLVRRELETDPDPEIRRLEGELRAMPSPSAARQLGNAATRPSGDSAAEAESNARANAEAAASIEEESSVAPQSGTRSARRGVLVAVAVAVLMAVTAGLARQNGWFNRDTRPVLAVGLIREDGVADSQVVGGVLTDMLATNLARVEGLSVLANSRILEMMEPGRDSSAAYANAARRAGASELIEGRVSGATRGVLELEVRRVELRSGIVREVYRARAADRYALIDTVTQAVAHRFRLASPTSSVAAATTSSPMAYRLYEEGLRAYFQLDARAAQRLMRAALEEDSTFAMAAYYEAVLWLGTDTLPDHRSLNDVQLTALRLARRATEGQRLMISAQLLLQRQEPEALAVAESLASRFPDDPRALSTLSEARWAIGDWPGAVQSIERAIVLDSAAELTGSAVCHVCHDFEALAQAYEWWDSLPAALRTERRYLKLRPDAPGPAYRLAFISAGLGDSAGAYEALRRSVALGGGDPGHSKIRIQLRLGAYEDVEREVRPLLASSAAGEWADGANALLFALRNEGRLRDAIELHKTGWVPGFPAIPRNPNDFDAGILAMERGEGRAAAAVFREKARNVRPHWAAGFQARVRTWNRTLEATALAAAGDTGAVRALIDSVEESGKRSAYGRDRKAHHYVRGLMFAAQHRDDDAAREFSAAIHSPNFGFTRVNYELGRALLRLGRPSEAVSTLQSSLRGEIDASNLYITRTDLHELLAQAFDAAGQKDSAAAHYRAVVSAWRRADPVYHARRALAAKWLERNGE